MRLRLLATSDLHACVLDWDYFAAKTDATVGLASLATLIAVARAECPATLLLDNGDFLQGTPLADYVAAHSTPSAEEPHPMLAVMAGLGYDAGTLGNHEFNYGLPFLDASLAGASFPFVCANVLRAGGAPFAPPYVVLTRELADANGVSHRIRVGVIGFVPPQIMAWDKSRLEGRLEVTDMVVAARRFVPELRAECDVLVALCHAGIRTEPWTEGMENAAVHVAGVPGIDAIVTGHSHRVFPGSDYAGLEGIDAVAGLLNGVPAVMPGFWGSHLGVIDLTLHHDGLRWTIAERAVEVRPIARRAAGKVTRLATPDAAVAAVIAPVHAATLAWVERPVGVLDARVHSYFVWAGYDPATALVNAAQIAYARPLLAVTPYADLPVLSSAAPYRAGYTPDGFIDIAAGPVSLRDVANLYLFSNNTVIAVKVTGAQIAEWLECSARAFATLDPAASGSQPLLDKRSPSYNFDTIAGLTYRFDLTSPPRYDHQSTLDPAARRVIDLCFEGSPIDLQREFIVITNNYRADGGGSFPSLAGAKVVLRAPDSNQETVLRYFRSQSVVAASFASPWTFAPTSRALPVHFDTGMGASARLADVPGLATIGEGEPGYLRVGFTLG